MDEVREYPPAPVFEDRSGRRHRLLRVVGTGVGAALATSLVLFGVALTGAAPLSIPGLPGRAGAVEPTRSPGPPAAPDPPRIITPPAAVTASPTTSPESPSATTRPGRGHTPRPHPSKSR